MPIASDDNRDRPESKARADAPVPDLPPELWHDLEPEAEDPLTEPPRTAIGPEAEDRERWMRDYIDREQRFRLYFARYIAGLLDHPSTGMKLWRWLIDDFRSERREQARYLDGGPEPGLIPWLRRRLERRRRPGPFRQ
jgi:hypothetical protein